MCLRHGSDASVSEPDELRDERARVIRAGCSLALAAVHGALVGRVGDSVLDVVIERGGRHACLLLSGRVERWDLDAIDRVASWPLPPRGSLGFACDGAPPDGLYVIDSAGRRWRSPDARGSWRDDGVVLTDGFVDGLRLGGDVALSRRDDLFGDLYGLPPGRIEEDQCEGQVFRATRLRDGAVLWEEAFDPGWRCDRDARYLLRRRDPKLFELFDGPVGMRHVAQISLGAPLRDMPDVAFHVASRLLALVGDDAVVVGSWDDWAQARVMKVPDGRWSFAEFTDDGQTLVLGASGRIARIDLATEEVRETLMVRGDGWVQLALDPVSGRVLGVGHHGALRVADPGANFAHARAVDPAGVFVAAAGTPDGRSLVTVSSDGDLRVRSRATGEVLMQMEAPVGEIHALAVSPDGREVIAAGHAALLRWSLATGLPGDPISLPLPYAKWGWSDGLAVSTDGRHVAPWNEQSVCVVDLAANASRPWEPSPDERDRIGRTEGVAFTDGTTSLRVIRDMFDDDEDDDVPECARCPLDGGASETLVRWPLARPRGHTRHVLSSDARLVWRMEILESTGLGASPGWGVVRVEVTSVDDATIAFARWELDRSRVEPCCAGRRLLAASVAGKLWLLSANGESVCTDWPRWDVRPLAFAPDDGALWVLDGTGLVAELVVPERLLRAPDR